MSLTLREHLQPYINFAYVEFGMSEEQFFRQTPKQWDGIMEAWINKERRADRRTARVCAVIAQAFSDGSTTITEDMFIPKTKDELDKEQTVEEMFESLAAIAPKAK